MLTRICKICQRELKITEFRLTPSRMARLHTCKECQNKMLGMYYNPLSFKVCSRCKENRPLAYFYKQKNGLMVWCKSCSKNYSIKRTLKNKGRDHIICRANFYDKLD